MDAAEDWLTIEQVASRFRLHVETVRRFAREGRLPATKLGKRYWISASGLDEKLRENLGDVVRADPSALKRGRLGKKTELAKRTKGKGASV